MPGDTLVTVSLLGFPLDLQQLSNAWHDELLREFALVALSREDGAVVSRHLLDLIDRTRETYAEFTDEAEASQVDMRTAGASRGDFDYHVPAPIALACVELNAALDEAEAFCASGSLLTIPPTALISAFRRWLLEEFVRQIRKGLPPLPWDEHLRAIGLESR